MKSNINNIEKTIKNEKIMQDYFIRKNTTELRNKLKSFGLNICKCSLFKGWDWLNYSARDNSIHGICINPSCDEDTYIDKVINNLNKNK